jgi:hypothetical protein
MVHGECAVVAALLVTPQLEARVLEWTTKRKPADGSTQWSSRKLHAAVFCVDEKTAIQALDRKDPVLPLSPAALSAMASSISGSSWLNQVELWFAQDRARRHRSGRLHLRARPEKKTHALHPPIQQTSQACEAEVFRCIASHYSRVNRYRPLVS